MKKYDELDKLFQSRLKDRNLDKEGTDWNLPPEGLFDTALSFAEDQPNEKPQKRNYTLLVSLIIFLIFSLATIGWYISSDLNKEVSDIKEDVELLKQESGKELVQKSNSISSSTKNSFDQNSKIENKEIRNQQISTVQNSGSAASAISNEVGTLSKTSQQISSTGVPPTSLNANSRSASEVTTPQNNIQSFAPITVKNSQSFVPFSKKESQVKIQNMQNLFTSVLPFDIKRRSLAVEDKLSEVAEKKVGFNTGFYIEGGLVFTSLNMHSPTGLSDALTRYDNWYPGYQISLGAQLDLSDRWQLDKSIQFQSIRNESLYQDEFMYDSENEHVNINGDDIYRSNLVMASPMGAFNRSVDIPLKDMEMEDGDMIQNITEIDQSFNILSAKIGLSYKLFSEEKWQISAQANAALNYIVGFQQNSITRLYAKTDMLVEDNFSTSESEMIKPWFSTGGLALQARYYPASNWFIGLRGGFEHSFQSIKKTMTASPESTHINGIRAGLQLGYRF